MEVTTKMYKLLGYHLGILNCTKYYGQKVEKIVILWQLQLPTILYCRVSTTYMHVPGDGWMCTCTVHTTCMCTTCTTCIYTDWARASSWIHCAHKTLYTWSSLALALTNNQDHVYILCRSGWPSLSRNIRDFTHPAKKLIATCMCTCTCILQCQTAQTPADLSEYIIYL